MIESTLCSSTQIFYHESQKGMGSLMKQAQQKNVQVPFELSLPKGTKVIGFELDQIKDLTVRDVARACVERGMPPTHREMVLLDRYGYDPELQTTRPVMGPHIRIESEEECLP